jgi:hypothetical protein
MADLGAAAPPSSAVNADAEFQGAVGGLALGPAIRWSSGRAALPGQRFASGPGDSTLLPGGAVAADASGSARWVHLYEALSAPQPVLP